MKDDKSLPRFEPLLIERRAFADLPSVDYIVQLAHRADWIILQVPTEVTFFPGGRHVDPTQTEKSEIVAKLTALLPQHAVRSGLHLPQGPWPPRPGLLGSEEGSNVKMMSRVTVRKVVSVEAIEQHFDSFVAKLQEHRVLTNSLMERLARQLLVELPTFAASDTWDGKIKEGRLSRLGQATDEPHWRFRFWESNCHFIQQGMGLTVSGSLGLGDQCGNDFAVFDPEMLLYFAYVNASTIPSYGPLHKLLGGSDINATVVFDLMEKRELLRRIRSDNVTYGQWAFR